jgi:hypothetical protein
VLTILFVLYADIGKNGKNDESHPFHTERSEEAETTDKMLISNVVGETKKRTNPIEITDCSIFPGICKLDLTKCNIERRKGLTWKEFNRDYVQTNKPVIMTDIIDSTWAAAGWADSNIKAMAEKLGDQTFDYDDDELSVEEVWEKFDAYEEEPVSNELAHAGLIKPVGMPKGRLWPEKLLWNKFDLFPMLQDIQELMGYSDYYDNNWLIMGPVGAGTTLHKDYYDSVFMNALIQGSKYWALMEPYLSKDIGSKKLSKWMEMSNHEWYETEFSRLPRLNTTYYYCRQNAGEVMWVPGGFYHQTVNFERSITVGANYISFDHLHLTSSAVAFPDDGLEGDDPLYTTVRGMYYCTALRLLNEKAWKDGPCGSDEYLSLLDDIKSVVAYSDLDQLKNSDYYATLMRKAATKLSDSEDLMSMRATYDKMWKQYNH